MTPPRKAPPAQWLRGNALSGGPQAVVRESTSARPQHPQSTHHAHRSPHSGLHSPPSGQLRGQRPVKASSRRAHPSVCPTGCPPCGGPTTWSGALLCKLACPRLGVSCLLPACQPPTPPTPEVSGPAVPCGSVPKTRLALPFGLYGLWPPTGERSRLRITHLS